MRAPRFVREIARTQLRKRGLAVVRYKPDQYAHLLRHQVLCDQGVSVVLDVGANVGQHVDHLRGEGYGGRILSFEPASEPFAQLVVRTARDPLWEARQLALSDTRGPGELRLFAESAYNSMLPGVPGEVPAEAGFERVEQDSLDALEGDAWTVRDRICLKIDVQGMELEVLRGGARLLSCCRVVEIELSTVPMYEGQALFPEITDLIYSAGMRMISFRPIVVEPNGYVDQADALFIRVQDD
jgi:FkbM family methyltransferase